MKDPIIGIIGGKGKMGRLFASFFKERGIKVIVSDRGTKLTNKELAQKADLTIVSVPIDKTEKAIKGILPHIKTGGALTDFTSVKQMPLKAMKGAKVETFGLHPMFGDGNPIPGQTIIMCPTKKSGKYYKWMQGFLKENGAKIEEMTPKEHDKMMSNTQALIHFADISFANGLAATKMPIKDFMSFSSKASQLKVMLAIRLIDQDPGLYGNIQIQNPNTMKSLKAYRRSIDKLLKIVAKGDQEAFKKYFLRARKNFKSYSSEAYKSSSYLIDKMIEKQNRETRKTRKSHPKKQDLAILGPKHTYSDIAAGDAKHKYYTKNIEEVFDLVEKGKVAEGLVPVENKLNGTIREVLDLLFRKKVHVRGSVDLPIHHCLITLGHAKKTDIKTIISHSQPINQCKKYINANFPKVSTQYYSSTAAATEKLLTSSKKSIAIVGSKQLAEAHNLKILASDIEDEIGNKTTFLYIKKGQYKSNSTYIEKQTTSIAFHFDSDSAGSLFTVFKDFADAKINMTRIESRPTKTRLGDYIFYLDFNGNPAQPKIARTLKRITKKVAKLKILGTY